MPEIALNNVVFPAPLGPMTAHVSPDWTVIDRPSSAVIPPKRIVRSLISSTATPPLVADRRGLGRGPDQ
jgi:hypothetical protein